VSNAGESEDDSMAAPTCCHMLLGSCFRMMTEAKADLEEKIEVAAHVTGITEITGTLGPTKMMLCKPDLSDKHERWFRIDADACTIEWSKNAQGDMLVLPTKGPFGILSVEEVQGGILEIQTSCCSTGAKGLEAKFRQNSGEIVRIKPGGGYQTWLECCTSVVAKRKGGSWVQDTAASMTTCTGVRGPTSIMLCKSNLKNKHARSIRINCDECTIEWAEKWQGEGAAAVRKGGKGPYLLTAVREVQPAVTKLVDTVRLHVLVRSAVYRFWLLHTFCRPPVTCNFGPRAVLCSRRRDRQRTR
jgi:hypothetical protein